MPRKQRLSNTGFSVIGVVIVMLAIAILGLGGWYVWQKNQEATTQGQANTAQTQNNIKKADNTEAAKQAADPSEGGKYLAIKEWGVRFSLPPALEGRMSYSLSDTSPDEDGNHIQAATPLVEHDPNDGGECAVIQNASGSFIDSGAQILRVEKDKPLNTKRYRWTFEENILTSGAYVYHLNYVTPGCEGPKTRMQIKELQNALSSLEKID